MFRSIGRGIKTTATGSWRLFVRLVSVLINAAILAGIIFVSVGHSYSLLIYSGMSGTAAWVFVFVWESVFIYCSMRIQSAFQRGQRSSPMAWIGFLMGFIFVEISNYMGMGENRIAKGIGISTPFLLLVMKGVLADQFRDKKETWMSKLFNWIMSKLFRRKADIAQTDKDGQKDTDARTVASGQTNDINRQTKLNGQMSPGGRPSSNGHVRTDTDIKADVSKTDTTDSNKTRNGHSDIGQTNADPDANGQPKPDKKKKRATSGQTKKKVVSFKDKKSDTDAAYEAAKKFALDYYLQNQKHYPIRQLADDYGIKKHRAENIRKEINALLEGQEANHDRADTDETKLEPQQPNGHEDT